MSNFKMNIRKLKKDDISDVIELLQSLSVFTVHSSKINKIWEIYSEQNFVHSRVVESNDKIIGFGSLITEVNIRGGKSGLIKDIVCHKDYRKLGVGKYILDNLYNIAKSIGCYKIVLECKEKNIQFYKKCEYDVNGISMVRFM